MFATVAKLVGNRVLIAVPILLIVSVLLFLILRILPVDPAAMSLPPNATFEEVEAKRREMGLDLPLVQQYGIWLQQGPTARFPNGVLYAAHDDRGVGAFDWRDIAKALDLRTACR